MNMYDVTVFRASKPQRLRNVTFHSPSIVQILSGDKSLFWKDKIVKISSSSLLLCDDSLTLSFENCPIRDAFTSRFFSFYYLPPKPIVELSKKRCISSDLPIIRCTRSLEKTFNALYLLRTASMSAESQTFFLMGLYQQLAEQGVLPWLFRSFEFAFNHKNKRFLSTWPSQEHTLDSVAKRFSISRSTLIRRLNREGYQFKEMLLEVRLNYALNLMQGGQYNLSILAQQCGYKSELRFTQRFRQKFGLTPKAYLNTLKVFGESDLHEHDRIHC